MRTSFLSRSVIAVASLAIGSVALAATPATAAPADVTRDQVLSAVNSYRTVQTEEQYYNVVLPQFRAIARAACNLPAGDDASFDFDIDPTATGQGADGFLLKAYIDDAGEDAPRRQCLIAAIASTNPAQTLSGNMTVNATTEPRFEDGPVSTLPVASYALSGGVFVSTPINVSTETVIGDSSFAANGNATRSFKVTTTKKVADKKSTSEKKAAKKKFDKRNAAAKKAYKKALDKAGNSKSKKAAAKKAWSKKKASYKAKYKYATAKYKFVKKTATKTESTPFALNGEFVYEN